MLIKVRSTNHLQGNPLIRLRCPGCRQLAVLSTVGVNDVQLHTERGALTAGQRKCPDYGTHVFFLSDGTAHTFYPSERLDFDDSGLPDRVRETLAEAVACHANGCYTAAAMLIRKTLEVVCVDKGATGKDLQARIEALRGLVILPAVLLDGMHDLRFLGNDAAHIDAKSYDQVGKEEVEVAVAITTEILKSIYQMDAIVDRLKALKKPPTP